MGNFPQVLGISLCRDPPQTNIGSSRSYEEMGVRLGMLGNSEALLP